jgi:hypothetical protein
MGWAGLKNGELLARAETHGFDVLLTFDQNMPRQQHLPGRKISILVIAVANKRLETVVPLAPRILAMLPMLSSGEARRIEGVADDGNVLNPATCESHGRTVESIPTPDGRIFPPGN